MTLRSLALCDRAEGALTDAERQLHEALRIFAALRDTFGVMYTEQSLAKTELRLGRPDEARARLSRCLAVARERQDRFGEALVLRTLGEWHLAVGDPDGAREPLERALSTWEALRLPCGGPARSGTWPRCGRHGDASAARAARAEALGVFRELGCREAQEPTAGAG